MTKAQFEEVLMNFVDFGGKVFEYSKYIPSADKYVATKGCLRGVNTGVLNEELIFSNSGYLESIHYSVVVMPKVK